MNNIILTIAIPTYNRVKSLEFGLSRLLPEIKEHSKIEIVISDNASTDGTQAYIEDLKSQYSMISYYRNETNLGMDRNFLNCYEKAKGKYVWLLSDNDYVLPGAINSILATLEKNPVTVFLNCCSLLDHTNFKISYPKFSFKGDIIYKTRDEALKGIGGFIGKMSCFILKNELVQKVSNKEEYFDSLFIQSHLLVLTMATEGIYIQNTRNNLALTTENTVAYDPYYAFFESYHKIFSETAPKAGFNKEICENLYLYQVKSEYLKYIYHFRKNSKESEKWNRDYILNNLPPKSFLYYKALMIISLPISFLRFYSFVRELIIFIPRSIKRYVLRHYSAETHIQ